MNYALVEAKRGAGEWTIEIETYAERKQKHISTWFFIQFAEVCTDLL